MKKVFTLTLLLHFLIICSNAQERMNSRINKIETNIRYLDDSTELSENTSGIYDSDEATSDIEIANATINVGDI